MGGGVVAGLSLTRDQLVLLVLVGLVLLVLLTSNLGLCCLYHRLLTEDRRQVRKAQKKKMSDVWVYHVNRPSPRTSNASPPPPPPQDPPSQQILRKLRPSYDNLRRAVEEEEEKEEAGGVGRLGREESQVIEELEVTADLFLQDASSGIHTPRSSLSIHSGDVHHHHHADHTDVLDVDSADLHWPSATDPASDDPLHRPSHRCRSPIRMHSAEPEEPPCACRPDWDLTGSGNIHRPHDSVPRDTHTSAADEAVLRHADGHAENDFSALPDVDVCALDDLDEVSVPSVTLEDFENDPGEAAGTGRGQRRRERGAKGQRRGSSYDNLSLPFPVAEFHNEAFAFTAGVTASVEVTNDLEL